MSRPIEETPILSGMDAKRFMEAMKNPKPISLKERKRIFENYEAMSKIVIADCPKLLQLPEVQQPQP